MINANNSNSINVFTYLQNILDSTSTQKDKFKILEAGCGSISRLRFSENHLITGIDISQKQLDRNQYIHEKILGDIQKFSFPPSNFDMIVCWHVLEHLSNPQSALEMFFNTIKKDGWIIISSPNPNSLKGLVTKFTPHLFHVFVYRSIYQVKNAGMEDTAPFKTFMRFAISPKSIMKLAKRFNIKTEKIVMEDAFKDWVGQKLKKKSRILFLIVNLINKTLKVMSFGKIGDSEYTLVLKKQ